MKNKISITLSFVICMIAFARPASGQTQDPQLNKTILHMDSVMFDAFNTHNLEVMETLFAANLEFYHDKGGLNDYTATINSFKNVFKSVPDLKRELVPGSMEVYPIPGYGAVEMGIHRFTHMENGKPITGSFKFIHTWQFKDNQWKVTRVVSVGH